MSAIGYGPIQHYRTNTAGTAPTAGNLTAGELAINYADADMALYAKNNSGAVKRIINNPAGLKYPTTDGSANQVVKTDGSGNLTFATPLTSVSATAPIVSSGGSTPTISMAYTPAIQKGTATEYGGAKFSLSGTTLTITTT